MSGMRGPYPHSFRNILHNVKRLSQNKLEMASIVSSQIGFIRIFLKREVYKLSFEDFILSNCFSRCHKPPKRLLLQDYVL